VKTRGGKKRTGILKGRGQFQGFSRKMAQACKERVNDKLTKARSSHNASFFHIIIYSYTAKRPLTICQ